MRVAVIGSGHAGVEAAKIIAGTKMDVCLFSDEPTAPYYRPRLPGVAFGQDAPEAILMRPAEWYAAQGIELRLNAPVTGLNPVTNDVTAGERIERFDGVVLATGAEPIMPPFAVAPGAVVLTLWCVVEAQAVRTHVRRDGHAIILGGGILGIEAALRAREAGMRVTIVERLARLMPAQFGAHASAVLLDLVRHQGVEALLQRTVVSADAPSSGRGVVVGLDDGRRLEGDLCLVSVGARPRLPLAKAADLATERGIRVDEHLRTSAGHVFAAGDAIQFAGITRCSVREATAQGRTAGANLAATLTGTPLTSYRPENAPLSFKYHEMELHAMGDPGGSGSTEWLLNSAAESALRSLVLREGTVAGVQMIGTHKDLNRYLDMVKQRAPVPNREPERLA